ncbi:MAG TPA: DMT family transporter [Candidatus Sulfotelmatobacter sp.]|jgi:drug/metabolite transporter (DMT)-like permease|nr:DMT family transporter [Candidatus Sulfotelmatobacter sp.]
MASAPQFATAVYSLAAVFIWGTSDFLGGYATRRANAFLFTTIVNIGGLLLVGTLAAGTHAQFPSGRSVAWVLAGGISGGASLAIFYRALSSGRMGLTAPVAAVLSAVIPAVVAMFTEGLPGRIAIFGFFLAAVGLWLITRSEGGTTPEGIELALIAGTGFAGFYLCVRQAGDGSAFWIATFTRTGGLLITAAIVLARRKFSDITAAGVRWGLLTGCVDSIGTVFFVRASQSGRLDEAVVLSSLYPAVTVLLARLFLKEHFTRWRFVGLLAALAAVPMIATG